jgi:hypothetical protein
LAIMVSLASAVRNPPKKAGKFQSSVVQGYDECTATNTNTVGGVVILPACQPAVPSDPGCVFTDKGGGKLSAKAKDDVGVQVKLKGLDAACNGEELCARASFRATSDTCAAGPDCTAADVANFPLLACCTVVDGKCQAKTSVNTEIPGAIVPGSRLEIELLGCDLLRTGQAESAFRCGVMIP